MKAEFVSFLESNCALEHSRAAGTALLSKAWH
jgi:hypothetical protein